MAKENDQGHLILERMKHIILKNTLKEIKAKNGIGISQHVFTNGKPYLTNLIAFTMKWLLNAWGESSECHFSQIKKNFWNCHP